MLQKHKCPLCNYINTTKPDDRKKYKQKYLDGHYKMPFSVYMCGYHLCSKCGAVYYLYKNTTLFLSEETIKIIKSEKYQNIFKGNIPENLKLLKLIKEISKSREIIGKDINWLHLKYYEDIRDYKNIQKYLSKVIKEVENGIYYTNHFKKGDTCINLNENFSIRKNEILVDLYRRAGMFEKAKELITTSPYYTTIYSKTTAQKQYYDFQLSLIEKQIKRHI